VEKLRLSPTWPLDGPVGVFGVLTVSPTSTLLPLDQLETIAVWVAHRACALTVRVPWLDQECEALVDDDQSEYDPSPQSKRYRML